MFGKAAQFPKNNGSVGEIVNFELERSILGLHLGKLYYVLLHLLQLSESRFVLKIFEVW